MTEREQFSKWMSDNHFPLHECPYTGRYETPEVRMAWVAWQARAELAELERKARDDSELKKLQASQRIAAED